MDRIRVGVLGAGDVAQQVYLPGIARLSRKRHLDLVDVCDAIEERMTKAASTHDVRRAFTSYDAMLPCRGMAPAAPAIRGPGRHPRSAARVPGGGRPGPSLLWSPATTRYWAGRARRLAPAG